MPTVEVPGIGDVHLPDGMSNVEMEGTIKKLLVEKQSGRLDPSKVSSGTLSRESVQGAMAQKADSMAQDVEHAQKTGGSLMSRAEAATTAPVTAQPPRFPKAEKFLQAAAGPVATGVAGLATGGASIPLQMGLGAAIEAAGEKLGGEDLHAGKIASAALLPPAIRGAGQIVKPVARGAAKVFGGENLIQGGIQKIEKTLGKEAVDASAEKALNAAKSITVPAAQTETGKVVSEILKKKGRIAGTDSKALSTAEEIVRNTVNAAKSGNPIRYNEVFEQAKNMRAMAQEAKGGKEHFMAMREAMLKDLASISPEAKDAVTAYRKSAAITDITDALKRPNPARWVRETLDDPLVKGVFTKEQEHVVETVSKHIGNAGLLKIGGSLASLGAISAANPIAGGAAVLAPAIMGALVATPKVGAVLARSLVGPEGKINSAALPALAQMVRGYLAENNGNN